jgi:uncharacterized protein (TIRG00374 family)
LRVALQALVSVALIWLLVTVARRGNLADNLAALRPEVVAAAAGLLAVAYALNSWRWQFLLAHVDVRERLPRLTVLYFIGQFFSLFLPTSAGGDAYRVYEVSRNGRPLLRVFYATVQERLLGLGVVMLIGLLATLYYAALLPPSLWLAIVLVQVAGTASVAALLYPGPLLALASRWCPNALRAWTRRLASGRLAERLTSAARSLREMPPLGPARCLLVVALAAAANLLGIACFVLVDRSLGLGLSFSAYCLVVPLVWVVRMLPVSLNGIGVGEGAFVFLLGLFAISADKALALALTFLGLQTGVALFGGLLLMGKLAGGWRQRTSEAPAAKRRPVPPLAA